MSHNRLDGCLCLPKGSGKTRKCKICHPPAPARVKTDWGKKWRNIARGMKLGFLLKRFEPVPEDHSEE